MDSPYRQVLSDLKGTNVIVNRADAKDVRGEVLEASKEVCVIALPSSTAGNIIMVTIAYQDIRGVANEDRDPRDHW
ncbi:MAG TPA: hypothetical protein VJH71_00240 [Candidatus Paceibacterota bacterium]